MTATAGGLALAVLLLAPAPAAAQPGAASAPSAAPASAQRASDPRRSGREDMSAQTRAMQDDDRQNPGLLWLQSGAALWRQGVGEAGRSCADCHGEPTALRGAATRYPAWDTATRGPLTLGQRIQQCRVTRQRAAPLPVDGDDLLSLETLVAHGARGQVIQPDTDPRLAPWTERGRQRYFQRLGQLNLSCAQCHDDHAGQRLGGSLIPQGHPTGYPQYRLEWQTLGSLQRRLRACLTGVRAEPFAPGAIEWTELELYLKQRAAGMPLETPAVRP